MLSPKVQVIDRQDCKTWRLNSFLLRYGTVIPTAGAFMETPTATGAVPTLCPTMEYRVRSSLDATNKP
jgi:hypothetical protein